VQDLSGRQHAPVHMDVTHSLPRPLKVFGDVHDASLDRAQLPLARQHAPAQTTSAHRLPKLSNVPDTSVQVCGVTTAQAPFGAQQAPVQTTKAQVVAWGTGTPPCALQVKNSRTAQVPLGKQHTTENCASATFTDASKMTATINHSIRHSTLVLSLEGFDIRQSPRFPLRLPFLDSISLPFAGSAVGRGVAFRDLGLGITFVRLIDFFNHDTSSLVRKADPKRLTGQPPMRTVPPSAVRRTRLEMVIISS